MTPPIFCGFGDPLRRTVYLLPAATRRELSSKRLDVGSVKSREPETRKSKSWVVLGLGPSTFVARATWVLGLPNSPGRGARAPARAFRKTLRARRKHVGNVAERPRANPGERRVNGSFHAKCLSRAQSRYARPARYEIGSECLLTPLTLVSETQSWRRQTCPVAEFNCQRAFFSAGMAPGAARP